MLRGSGALSAERVEWGKTPVGCPGPGASPRADPPPRWARTESPRSPLELPREHGGARLVSMLCGSLKTKPRRAEREQRSCS